VALGTSYIIKPIRLLAIEDLIFDHACDALGGLERAQLMQEAVLFEACRLGVSYSSRSPLPLKTPWPYLPERGDGPTVARTSISLRVTVAEMMSIAAKHVNATEPLFIIGSTLAHIGRLQRFYRGLRTRSGQASKVRAALQRIELPPRYSNDGAAVVGAEGCTPTSRGNRGTSTANCVVDGAMRTNLSRAPTPPGAPGVRP
jgi:hypothetical protein